MIMRILTIIVFVMINDQYNDDQHENNQYDDDQYDQYDDQHENNLISGHSGYKVCCF